MARLVPPRRRRREVPAADGGDGRRGEGGSGSGGVGGVGGGAPVGGGRGSIRRVRRVQGGDGGSGREGGVRASMQAPVALGVRAGVAPAAAHLPVLPARASDRERGVRDGENVEGGGQVRQRVQAETTVKKKVGINHNAKS